MENPNVLQLAHQIFSDFYLCYCGYASCEPLQHFGPAVRPNYLIYYIMDGKGEFQSGGNRVSLHAGEGFLIRPNEQAFFQADESAPWTYLWIGFDGARCAEYLKAIGLDEGQQTYRSPDGEKLKEIVQEMLRYNTAGVENDFLLQGLLCRFFACLARSLSIPLSAVAKNDRCCSVSA